MRLSDLKHEIHHANVCPLSNIYLGVMFKHAGHLELC